MKINWRTRKSGIKEPVASTTSAARTLVVSKSILRDTHVYFAPYWRARVETACFWFGVNAGDKQVVTTVAAPKLFQTSGNYLVERSSMSRVAAEMRAYGLTNLAQVHTHPSKWIGHSSYDDDHAYSTREGALSLVWADYGFGVGHGLGDVGVHERRGGEWVRLEEKDIYTRIRIVDSFADYRWEIDCGAINDDE